MFSPNGEGWVQIINLLLNGACVVILALIGTIFNDVREKLKDLSSEIAGIRDDLTEHLRDHSNLRER